MEFANGSLASEKRKYWICDLSCVS
jgi:hypothetical protein